MNRFGFWFEDEWGLPAFEYTCDQFNDQAAYYFNTRGGSRLHWHQIGNDRITAVATNYGEVFALESSRGLQWLNYHDSLKFCPGAGIAIVSDGETSWSDLCEPGDPSSGYKRIFGCGYFKKSKTRGGVALEHTVVAPFGDDPVLHSTITVTNISSQTKNFSILDFYGVNPHYITMSLLCSSPDRLHFSPSPIENGLVKALNILLSPSLDMERRRSEFAKKFRFGAGSPREGLLLITPEYTGSKPPERAAPASRNYYPNPQFIARTDSSLCFFIADASEIFECAPRKINRCSTSNDKENIDLRAGFHPSETDEQRLRLSGRKETAGTEFEDGSVKFPCLCAGVELSLKPGERKELSFLYGYSGTEEAEKLAKKYFEICEAGGNIPALGAAEWRKRKSAVSIPALDVKENTTEKSGAKDSGDGDESRYVKEKIVRSEKERDSHKKETLRLENDIDWLRRETAWHAYYTRSAFLHDEFYGLHYAPQGGVYEYLHGLRGAVRDLALYTPAAAYLCPPLARDLLEYCFRLMSPNGKIVYAAHGYGMGTGAVMHKNPGDLQLFLFYALCEYVFFTRDFDFLDSAGPWFSGGSGARKSAAVFDKILAGVNHLMNGIGLGEHGLLRCGDGDWSDGISLFVKERRKFVEKGESVFTSAMALYVLPRVAALIEGRAPAAAAKLRAFTDGLKIAVMKCWNGKWFHRAYDGAGRPVGEGSLFLEHHVWLLISRALPDDKAMSVVANIYEILDRPSAFGQYVLYPPVKTLFNPFSPGWDVNGGVWFAINFLLAWGYALYDREKGWEAFKKNSMTWKASVDPGIWYGVWSGPDSFNANYAPRPGETFYHPPSPGADFPVMNLNLHAGFIAALVHLCGIEPGPEGVMAEPLLPFDDFSAAFPTFDLRVASGIPSLKMRIGPERAGRAVSV